MIPFRGWLNFKKYVPAKPTTLGIKVWMICRSQSGYCLDFDIYTGWYTEVSENELGYDVVRELTLQYQNQHYHIYFDQFFTSPLIVAELLRNHTYACGTVMLHRKGLPAKMKKRKVPQNAVINYQKEDQVLMTWKDKRQVNILSTNYPAVRNQNLANGKKPAVVEMYKKHMAGVERHDQLNSCCRIDRASHKWW